MVYINKIFFNYISFTYYPILFIFLIDIRLDSSFHIFFKILQNDQNLFIHLNPSYHSSIYGVFGAPKHILISSEFNRILGNRSIDLGDKLWHVFGDILTILSSRFIPSLKREDFQIRGLILLKTYIIKNTSDIQKSC